MKKLILIISVLAFQVKGQDTIRFVDSRTEAVKVSEIGLNEIKYNRFDNLTGPVYVVNKNEVKYIRYSNGSVDSFTVKKPVVAAVVVESTPGYVNNTPTEKSFEKIQIIRKRLYYEHHGLNDRGMLQIIKEYPDQKTKNIMLREFSKITVYKKNRMTGLFLLYGGITACVFSSAFGNAGVLPVFAIGAAAGISGSIIATMNKNKRNTKRVEIAKIYNGEYSPATEDRSLK